MDFNPSILSWNHNILFKPLTQGPWVKGHCRPWNDQPTLCWLALNLIKYRSSRRSGRLRPSSLNCLLLIFLHFKLNVHLLKYIFSWLPRAKRMNYVIQWRVRSFPGRNWLWNAKDNLWKLWKLFPKHSWHSHYRVTSLLQQWVIAHDSLATMLPFCIQLYYLLFSDMGSKDGSSDDPIL